jgi:aminotransferase
MVNVQAPTISQWGAVAAFDGPQDCVEDMRRTYDERRRFMMPALRNLGFTFGPPHGGLYVWANISSTGQDAMALSYQMLKDGDVLMLPGTGFGEQWSDYMRLTILQPVSVLEEVVRRMTAVIERHRVPAGRARSSV